MSDPITPVLLADGTTDAALLPLINWMLNKHYGIGKANDCEWAEHGKLPKSLSGKMAHIIRDFECDLLFVHRDAEKQPHTLRIEEIHRAYAEALKMFAGLRKVPYVCVIPVRMQEAWFLFDEAAIRNAAGNPNGRVPLKLPRLKDVEGEPDPKALLDNLLREATEFQVQRRKNFRVEKAKEDLARYIEDFTPLEALPAFRRFEGELKGILAAHFNT